MVSRDFINKNVKIDIGCIAKSDTMVTSFGIIEPSFNHFISMCLIFLFSPSVFIELCWSHVKSQYKNTSSGFFANISNVSCNVGHIGFSTHISLTPLLKSSTSIL